MRRNKGRVQRTRGERKRAGEMKDDEDGMVDT